MNIVWPPVQQYDRYTAGWSAFGVANVQDAGINLMDRSKHPGGAGLVRRAGIFARNSGAVAF
jgi:hypothetical protein